MIGAHPNLWNNFMYWRQVRNKSYLYRSFRDADRVRKVYYGSGSAAAKAAHEAVERTTRRLANMQRLSDLRTSWQSLQLQIASFRQYVRGLMHATLWKCGFYQHHREWRRRRVHSSKNGK
jgi:hypothetical protein